MPFSFRESRQRLDTLLREWAAWHVETYPAGYRPPEVLGGILKYDTAGPLASLPLDNTLPVVEDRPHRPSRLPSQTVYFNVNYEKTEEIPNYDRAIDTLLTSKRSDTHFGKSLGIDSASDIDAVTETRPRVVTAKASTGISKRFKSTQRCFNCGSYGHTLRECWKEYDDEAVEAAKSSMRSGGKGAGQFRYFVVKEGDDLTDGGAQEKDENENNSTKKLENEFPEVVPGQLSAELRYALGLGPTDPPPWLGTMRMLGAPPWYQSDEEEDKEEGEEESTEEGALIGKGNDINDDNDNNGSVPEFIPLPPKHRASQKTRPAPKVAKFPGINAPLPEGADPLAWNEVPAPPIPMTALKHPNTYFEYPSPPPPPPYAPPPYSYSGSYPHVNYASHDQHHYPQQDWNPNYAPDQRYYAQGSDMQGGQSYNDRDRMWYGSQDHNTSHQYHYSYGQ